MCKTSIVPQYWSCFEASRAKLVGMFETYFRQWDLSQRVKNESDNPLEQARMFQVYVSKQFERTRAEIRLVLSGGALVVLADAEADIQHALKWHLKLLIPYSRHRRSAERPKDDIC